MWLIVMHLWLWHGCDSDVLWQSVRVSTGLPVHKRDFRSLSRDGSFSPVYRTPVNITGGNEREGLIPLGGDRTMNCLLA